MACPECSALRREYLVFRKAVESFAGILDQLENERRRIADESRPVGVPPLCEPLDQMEGQNEPPKRRSAK